MWICPKCGPVGNDVLHVADEAYHCLECDAACHILTHAERNPPKGQWNRYKKKGGRRRKPPPPDPYEELNDDGFRTNPGD